MSSTFKYRLSSFGSLGGLAADLTAERRAQGAGEEPGLRVHRDVWLTLPCGTYWRDAAWLSFGLSAHSADLASAHPGGLVVEVTALAFPLAHFRSEVAALAMDGWVRREFALLDRGLRAVPEIRKGVWRFEWGIYADPFSDEP